MVWNTTQSAFYKAIDAFNNGEKISEKQPDQCNDDHNEKRCDHSIEKCHEKRCEDHCPEEADRRCGLPCTNRCPSCRVCQRRTASPLSELFSDSDMLLIAGLILILSQQNADKKLILALAFVLLT
ncbi:MAG: hypothetical protein K2N56_01790 [Oscillospiraceae bacterium]|nr:hypothetical protein [Oscillospiraceae bacterium]